ncbi:MAG: carboxylating nicotinate-nucleotide diphosphorylase [Desulfobulbaceae bacterium]|nr:carboxylating nicotinate-nucleotide diphosphorylase [Desulfobulbaceae bacterium]
MDRLQIVESIKSFLVEDIGSGDLTSESIFKSDQQGKARFVAKDSFMVAGLGKVAGEVFALCNPSIEWSAVEDGTRVETGDILFSASGPVIDLLRAERVALNLAQRLSGVATLTARFVEKVMLLPVKIVDTRKTTPGLRMLEKYAVRVGGGHNHRFNLADGILIKDNHIAACGSIQRAVNRVRERAPHTIRIEVECETLEQVEACLAADVDIIMLDNMEPEMMREAVRIVKGRALLEASGGITLENIRSVAETGVSLISIGALTHSAPACDISMKLDVD